ncbi:hypothetical protein FA95DRAFT_1360443 [Auriscalpium vulgare]|uniref:Uncharacterized protein n=1 Tax=Auriscalpium vulgare TaxID=40419 RepID=A0ACB8RRR2_9AGAM|nr:hypothetical protein FA95DRAFT_1360443 [Auriscalpium vulgare]
MAPSSRTPSVPAISQPFPLQKKKPAQASATRATASGTGSLKAIPSSASLQVAQPRPAPARADSERRAGLSRKRARRDTLDENADGGRADVPRVRQRLVSMSSTETIRPRRPSVVAAPVTPRAPGPRARGPPSGECIPGAGHAAGARPLAESNRSSAPDVAPAEATPRTLRRVGTLALRPSRSDAARAVDKYTARPASPSPPMVHHTEPQAQRPAPPRPPSPPIQAQDYSRPGSAQSTRRAPVASSSRTVRTPLPARASLERFDLKLSAYEKHVELWDLPDGSVYAWQGLLVVTDRAAGGAGVAPPLNRVDIACSTHAYEGRYSGETNALPVFSTAFRGRRRSGREAVAGARDFCADTGIVLANMWHAHPQHRQWYAKFWVPIPLDLFGNRDTRMFRFKAQVELYDDWADRMVTVSSGTIVADVSHLRKQRDMDGAAVLV